MCIGYIGVLAEIVKFPVSVCMQYVSIITKLNYYYFLLHCYYLVLLFIITIMLLFVLNNMAGMQLIYVKH